MTLILRLANLDRFEKNTRVNWKLEVLEIKE